MAIDSQGRWGPAVATAVKSFAAGLSTTQFITDAQLTQLWKVITGQHQSELNTHQDIILQAADIKVDPGTFSNGGGSVTGVGVSEAATLTQRTA